jgi:hypothetical protein
MYQPTNQPITNIEGESKKKKSQSKKKMSFQNNIISHLQENNLDDE